MNGHNHLPADLTSRPGTPLPLSRQMNNHLNTFLSLCDNHWKASHSHAQEQKMNEVLEAKRFVVRIYALAGFHMYHTIFCGLKTLRKILPPNKHEDYQKPAAILETIKTSCLLQIQKSQF